MTIVTCCGADGADRSTVEMLDAPSVSTSRCCSRMGDRDHPGY